MTPSRYWPVLKRFIHEKFSDGPLLLSDLGQQDIDNFLIRHAHESTPKVAQLIVTSMRSFFQFLFRYGETKHDLSLIVPTVPSWQLTEIPKYLQPYELETLLESCNRPSVWLSLDEDLNDFSIFLQYFLFAVRKLFPDACPGTLELLSAPDPQSAQMFSAELVSELSEITTPFIQHIWGHNTFVVRVELTRNIMTPITIIPIIRLFFK